MLPPRKERNTAFYRSISIHQHCSCFTTLDPHSSLEELVADYPKGIHPFFTKENFPFTVEESIEIQTDIVYFDREILGGFSATDCRKAIEANGYHCATTEALLFFGVQHQLPHPSFDLILSLGSKFRSPDGGIFSPSLMYLSKYNCWSPGVNWNQGPCSSKSCFLVVPKKGKTKK